MKAAIGATYVALSVTVLLLSWDHYKSALGQAQQQFQSYQNPTLGFSIQYPSDWQIEEEPGEQVTFVKERDIVEFLVDVHSLDSPDTTLAKQVQDEISNKREERQDFKLIESTPITISDGKAQAHKLVYTFLKEDDARAGETNKIQRIFTIEGDKVYSIAYLAEIDKFDDSLPLVEKMVDSFRLSDTGSGSSTTQVQSSDGSREDNNGSEDCDRTSYPDPDKCIPPYPPDLNCPDIPYKDFQVAGSDPHGFDGDNDGIGCDSEEGGGNVLTLTPTPTPTDICYLPGIGDWWDNPDCKDYLENKYKTIVPSPPTPTLPVTPTSTPEPEPAQGYCMPGSTLKNGICEPNVKVPGEVYCQALGCPGSPPDPSRPVTGTTTPEPTLTTPTPPVDPSLLARSQPQPQCEFGTDPETGLCNTEDIPSEPGTPTPKPEPLPSTPVPTTTPEEEFSTEEDVTEEPEEDIVEEEPEDEPEDKPEDNGESNEDNTTE